MRGSVKSNTYMRIMQGDSAVSSETTHVYDTRNYSVLDNRSKKCNYRYRWSVLEAKNKEFSNTKYNCVHKW